MMNDNIHKCRSCGSNRVVAGQLGRINDDQNDAISEEPAAFIFSELKEKPGYWTSFSISEPLPRAVSIRHHGSASVCLDCGVVNASLVVDIKDAKKVLNNWGTDALKSRLATDDTAGSDETKV